MGKSAIASGSGINVEAKALSKALGQVLLACHRKTTIPILATARISAEKGVAKFSCTDLDIEIRSQLPASGKLKALCVDPRVLRGIVRGLPASERVTLQAETDAELLVLVGDEQWRLPALDATDWPKIRQPEDAPKHASIPLDAGFIGDVFARVAPFISAEETRYFLNGILFDAEGGRLLAVATDGHRIGRVGRSVPGIAKSMKAAGFMRDDRRCIVGRDFIRATLSLVRGPARFTFGISPATCRIDADNISITGKMIDGTFPDYRPIVGEPSQGGYEVERLSFLSALDRLKAIEASGHSRDLALCWRDGALYLERRDVDRGRASIPVPAATFGDWPTEPLSFNRQYLASIAQQIRGSAFRLGWTGSANSQVQITDVSDPAATFILMPMRGDTKFAHEAPAAPKMEAAE